VCLRVWVGRDISVGIASHYGLDCARIVSRWGGAFFRTRPDRLGPHPASYTLVTRPFPGIKRPGRSVDRPHQEPRLKSRAIPLLLLWAFVACSKVDLEFWKIWTSFQWGVCNLEILILRDMTVCILAHGHQIF